MYRLLQYWSSQTWRSLIVQMRSRVYLNVGRMSAPCAQCLNVFCQKIIYIYTTVNFTNLSVTTEVGALYGRLICGWLRVVWAWSNACDWLGVVVARQAQLCGWLGVVHARKADLNWKL